jgi:uncharacterized protein (TIGR03086 family)
MDAISVFQRAIAQTGGIVAGVKPDQMGASTPCTDWDVRALLNHTIAGVQVFDDAARGRDFDASAFAADNVGDDPAAAFDKQAAKLSAAVSRPGVLDATWNMPFGQVPGTAGISFATLELAMHGWDIARATGQSPDFDPEVTEVALAAARQAPAELVRNPGVFGPEVPCSPDTPAHDRLAAFAGREI